MSAKSQPFISICIPAYKRTHYLQRLLQSVASQTFRDFEVVISDDSNDNSVELIVKEFEDKFFIRYYHNKPSLGTPANWNFAIGKANGEWIKLMHDDDWFANETALQAFANATKKGDKFITCDYDYKDDDGTIIRKMVLSPFTKKRILKQPMVLLNDNYIGQPSVVMVHRSVTAVYDERMKWRVDIDYYMQLLFSERQFTCIPGVLIHLGVNAMQVTNSCLNVPCIELPEGLMLLEKYGTKSLRNIFVYDAWWRIIRNTGTRNKETLYRYATSWPKEIINMTQAQSRINFQLLKNGVFSKLFMTLQYLLSLRKAE